MYSRSTPRRKKLDPLVIGLLIYFVLSMAYQAGAFILDKTTFFNDPKTITNNCYELRIRTPLVIPLSTPKTDGNGRPITIWAWKKNVECYKLAETLTVNLSDTNEIVFVNEKKAETTPSLKIPLANTEAEAQRKSIIVYSPLQEPQATQTTLSIEVIDGRSNQHERYDLPIQSRSTYFLLEFFGLVFGTTFFTITSFLLALAKIAVDAADRRKQEIKEFEEQLVTLAQRKEKGEEIEVAVLDLANQARRLGKVDNLRTIVGGSGGISSEFRRRTVEKIREIIKGSEKSRGELEEWLTQAVEVLGFKQEDKITLITFTTNLISPTSAPDRRGELTESALEIAKKALQILGLASSELIHGWLKNFTLAAESKEPKDSKWLETWHENSGASGRYVLTLLDNPDLAKRIEKINHDKPYPPNQLTYPYRLWPTRIAASKAWANPFGPLHAEEDPRLPPAMSSSDERMRLKRHGLFWEEAPLWKEVSSPQSDTYYIASGMGASALIWMGRWERRYWGRKPSLSIYVPLITAEATPTTFWSKVTKGLKESLFTSLVEDPFWLLGAPIYAQDLIGVFLQAQFGPLTRFMQILKDAGLPDDERTLVMDALAPAFSTSGKQYEIAEVIHQAQRCMAEASAGRVKPSEPFQTFFWTEIKQEDSSEKWSSILPQIADGLGVLKVFIVGARKRGPVADRNLFKWEKEQLRGLLFHRSEKTWRTAGWGEIRSAPEELIAKAAGSPRRLIEIGNKELEGRVS